MSSELERALARHRAAILAKDRETALRLLNVYKHALERLAPMAELAQWEMLSRDESPLDMVIDGRRVRASVFQLERYKMLESQLRAEMANLATATGSAVRAGQDVAIGKGQQLAFDLMQASVRDPSVITGSFAAVPFDAVRDAVGTLAPDSPVGKLLDSFGDDAATAMRRAITSGMALGQSPRLVADALETATEMTRNRALTIARTQMLNSYRSSALMRYERNSDILKGWKWTAAKQTRTCAACLAQDGQEYPLSVTFFPSHVNCRCSPRPVLKDEYAMPRDPVESGDEWLRRQDADVQDGILGKQGGAAWRAGEVQLSDFVRVDHSPTWGDSTRDGGIGWARRQAAKRERRAA